MSESIDKFLQHLEALDIIDCYKCQLTITGNIEVSLELLDVFLSEFQVIQVAFASFSSAYCALQTSPEPQPEVEDDFMAATKEDSDKLANILKNRLPEDQWDTVHTEVIDKVIRYLHLVCSRPVIFHDILDSDILFSSFRTKQCA